MVIATSPADLLDKAAVLGMSGLEFMEGVLNGTLPGPPIGQTMGFTLVRVEPGRCTFRGQPRFNVTNPLGTVHGGWYGTILDSAMACAVMTRVPRGSVYTTLEYKVNIIRPIPLETEVEAVGTVDHSGRSTGVASGEIRGGDGTLYATSSTTCIIMALAG